MPNWCQNRLLIIGDEGQVAEFIEKNSSDESPLDFDRGVPEPADNQDWYSWRSASWGTKWNACNAEPSDGPLCRLDWNADAVELIEFDTAWAPPLAWFRSTAPQWPKLELVLYFAELGMEYSGAARWRDGELSASEELTLSELINCEFEDRF